MDAGDWDDVLETLEFPYDHGSMRWAIQWGELQLERLQHTPRTSIADIKMVPILLGRELRSRLVLDEVPEN